MHTILTTPTFEAQAARAGLDGDTITEMLLVLAGNPKAGVVMPGTGGLRKLRHAGRGGGKSGGYRVIHFYGGDDIPVFVFALIDKGQQADLSQAAKNEFRRKLPEIVKAYRTGVKERVKALRRT